MSNGKPARRASVLAAAVAGVYLLAPAVASAAIITEVGSLLNTDGWRSSNVAKPAGTDPSGDGALGTDGYYVVNTDSTWLDAKPAYISSVTSFSAVAWYTAEGGLVMDNPTLSIGASVANWGPRLSRKGGSTNVYTDFYTITAGTSGTFLLTIISDADGRAAGVAREPTQWKVFDSAIPATFVEIDTVARGDNNLLPDFYVLSINANAGDVIKVQGKSTVDGSDMRVHGIAFEAVPVPEAGSVALVALGGATALLRRRRP